MEKRKIKDICYYLPKSKIKAGEGLKEGKYPFFTSSNKQTLWVDTFLYDGEYLVIGTGGTASCNYCNGKFAASTDNFVVGSSVINIKFLYYYLRANNMALLQNGFHGAGMQHISKEYFGNIEIPVLDSKRQFVIVETLDKISSALIAANLQLDKMDELVKSRFIELFGDPKTNSLNLGIDKPENLCESISAGGDRPKEVSEIRTDEFCYPIFSNGEKDDGLYGWSKEYRVEKPAVTVSGRGTIGYTCYRKEGKFTPIVRLIVMIPNERINPIYLTYYMNLEREEGSGSGVQQLTVPMIKQKNIIVPDRKSQNEFAKFVELIDKSKFCIKKCISYLQELLNKKMNEYFGS